MSPCAGSRLYETGLIWFPVFATLSSRDFPAAWRGLSFNTLINSPSVLIKFHRQKEPPESPMSSGFGPRVLVVQFGKTVEDVVAALSGVDGVLRDIILYGQDMRASRGASGAAYDGPGGSRGASLAIPPGLALSVPYSPLDTRFSHRVLKDPSIDEILLAVMDLRPTIVILHGGLVDSLTGAPGEEVLAPLPVAVTEHQDKMIAAIKDIGVKLVYLDCVGSEKFAQQVRTATGVPAVFWRARGEAPPVFTAYHFFFVFMSSILEDRFIHPEEAFAIASELTCAFCIPQNEHLEALPCMPCLLSDLAPALPGMRNKNSFPDDAPAEVLDRFLDVKLCASNVELRLLVLGIPAHLLASARLGSLCQGLRGILASEVSSATLTKLEEVMIGPPYLLEDSLATRCSMRTASGIAVDLVMSGPKNAGFHEDRDALESALRQVMIADVHSIQLRMPPVGASLPPYHSSSLVGGGAPTIEVMMSASLWVAYLLKRLTEMPQSKSLVMAGVAAASTSITTSFNKRDAIRHVAILCNGDLGKFASSKGTMTAEMLTGPTYLA